MPAFRILDQDPVYRDLNDVIAAGGHLRFYESGTTTPKDVYGDEALSINNGPEVLIGSDGRATVDIWGDGLGAYRVRLYDAADNLVSERDDVDIQGGGTTIPVLDSGAFLTNNGSVLQWADILQVPDPTGQSGKVLGNNGTSPIWQALAVITANCTITFVTGGLKLSDGTTARMVQFGSDTISASGATTASKVFTFGTAFSNPPQVFAGLSAGSGIANPAGGIPAYGVSGASTTGATMAIDTNGFNNITASVGFYWFAIGPVAA